MAAVEALAALRENDATPDDDAPLAASTRHLDVTAERAWAVARAVDATGVGDAAIALQSFRGILLASLAAGSRRQAVQLFDAPAVLLLGTVTAPLHVHLAERATGPAAFCAARRVLVARSVEEAETLMCALLLAGGRAACCATAAPALATALRDHLVHEGHVGTGRPALCDAPGLEPVHAETFTATTFAARGGREAGVTSRRAIWAEFLEHTLATRGLPALIAFARGSASLPPACAPAAAAAAAAVALDASAVAAFKQPRVPSFSAMLQSWAHETWEAMAHATPNEWAGGIGARTGVDPSRADKKASAAALAYTSRVNEPDMSTVHLMTIGACWRWLLAWLWREKRADTVWMVLAIVWNCFLTRTCRAGQPPRLLTPPPSYAAMTLSYAPRLPLDAQSTRRCSSGAHHSSKQRKTNACLLAAPSCHAHMPRAPSADAARRMPLARLAATSLTRQHVRTMWFRVCAVDALTRIAPSASLAAVMSENGGLASDGIPNTTIHGGLLPDFEIVRHTEFLIILVAINFFIQVVNVLAQRQLFIKARRPRARRVAAPGRCAF